jgi:quinolinate synthase
MLGTSIREEIQKLKKEKNVCFLAHYYEEGEIQDLADFVGDSFALAKEGQKTNAEIILLAGVVFMAESVKIMNPNKKVIVPDLEASCSLVKESPYEKYLEWRRQNPTGIAVTYINSSAEVKSISDVIVTSSNAAKIIEAIPKDRPILFGPDRNLGHFLSRKLNREMILWNGSCEVHIQFSAKKLFDMTLENPDAIVLAHPECDPAVLQYAHVIGSTSRLLEEVGINKAKKFIVATEPGIIHQMKKLRSDVTLLEAPQEGSCGCNNCPYMKMNTLEKIKMALTNEQPEVVVGEELRKKALVSLQRMMDITSDKPVHWPDFFRL